MDVPSTILQVPYKNLPVSNSMKRFFAVHGISTLEKLLEIRSIDLLEMKWFNARTYYELTCVLDKHGLLDRLK
jgi:hypothetical protein